MKDTDIGKKKYERKQIWPQIRERANGSWLVDARINGVGDRFTFKTLVEANTKALQLRAKRKNEGYAAFTIPEELRIEALKCQELLFPYEATLTGATEHYIEYLKATRKSKPVEKVLAEATAEKKSEHASKPTITEFEHRGGKFCEQFPGRLIGSISTEEIDTWLRTSFLNLVTRNNTRKVVVNLFNFAVRKGYANSNQAQQVKKAKDTRKAKALKKIGILTPEQVKELLSKAHSEVVPYFAIAAFAGLRPEELLKLKWSDVRWKHNVIRVEAHVSKVGVTRDVPISDNLAMWLAPYKDKIMIRTLHKSKREGGGKFLWPSDDGLVRTPSWRDQFRQARIDAEIRKWPSDCLRHSFASYWLEEKKDIPALALIMGNSASVITKHYHRVLDEPEDAKKYWAIVPEKAPEPGKVIPITAAAA